ncbi:DUF4178 domain-containing protein [Sphingomonas canadensis]|uniref:DUF4178 domain-containing protein n=1 Tax=Sphingomonas canadensis TaxID=1219257 RepID=A0ABW3HAS7_9SPHN|nr:DUF4178 domain-containing protein [Sphingomonas canadensis]MCW3838258.1 DUF4178 domain-containing protein [Sphingomonas canadensis]
MTLTLNCPNCGAQAVFRSPALPCRVCDYCQSLLVRNDAGVSAVGKAAALPFDVSPVRIGMRGRADGIGFEVVGRVRWAWTDGSWNEWLLLFQDGSYGWLGDAMGLFMLLREEPVARVRAKALRRVIEGGEAVPGVEAQHGGVKYQVSDARDVLCIAAEGELPFTAPPGWRVYSVDLKGPAGECATLQRDRDEATFYTGRYVLLGDLEPSGLRAIEGWGMPAYAS